MASSGRPEAIMEWPQELAQQQQIIGDFIDSTVKDQPLATRMLASYPELRTARWIHDESIPHFLAVESFGDAVDFLGRQGFDFNVVARGASTALIDACCLGLVDIVVILLQHGADPNLVARMGPPLDTAIEYGHADLIPMLLNAGARTDYVSGSGWTMANTIEYLDEQYRTDVIRALKDAGVRDDQLWRDID